MHRALVPSFLYLVLVLSAPVQARQLVLEGAIEELPLPADVTPNQVQSSLIRIFREQSGLALASSVPVDLLGTPGTWRCTTFPPSGPTPSLPAARYDVFLVHFDHDIAGTQSRTATIRFPSDIVGVIALSARLAASDGALGQSTTNYGGTTGVRGLEFGCSEDGRDSFRIENDPRGRPRVLHLELRLQRPNRDQMRVIVATPTTIESRCFGHAGCPCGNDVGPGVFTGCANSTPGGDGARLSWSGGASLGAANLDLQLSGLPERTFSILFAGSAATSVPFGQGLACVSPGPQKGPNPPWSFGLVRLGGGASQGGLLAVNGVVQGLEQALGPLAAGQTVHLQGYYRNPAFVCPSDPAATFNFTNALSVTFEP